MADPDDSDVEATILEAAGALAAEAGLESVTVNAVAQRAGVSRPTVYRRFPGRAALVFELQLLAVVPVEMPDTGTLREDLCRATAHLVTLLSGFDRGLHGERLALMANDQEFAERVWRERWIPDRDAVAVIWDRAVERGEADPTVDGREVINDLVATSVFRSLFWHESGTGWIEPYVDRVCRGVCL